MTATATMPKPAKIAKTPHYVVMGRTTFVCIQPNCNGKRHVFCSCAR